MKIWSLYISRKNETSQHVTRTRKILRLTNEHSLNSANADVKDVT